MLIADYSTGNNNCLYPCFPSRYYNQKMFDDMEHICYELGHFYQIQNDFFDCFSDASSVLKKPGTDIEDGKCTWLAVKAMENGTRHQKAIMEKCYGRDGMYSDLDLSKLKLTLSGCTDCLLLVPLLHRCRLCESSEAGVQWSRVGRAVQSLWRGNL